MKNVLKKMLGDIKGAFDIAGVVVDVVLVVALIPVIAGQISVATNLSSTETTLLGLTTLFIVLALIINIARQSGLIKRSS